VGARAVAVGTGGMGVAGAADGVDVGEAATAVTVAVGGPSVAVGGGSGVAVAVSSGATVAGAGGGEGVAVALSSRVAVAGAVAMTAQGGAAPAATAGDGLRPGSAGEAGGRVAVGIGVQVGVALTAITTGTGMADWTGERLHAAPSSARRTTAPAERPDRRT